MEARPDRDRDRRGRPMRGTRSVAGTYFDLACEMVGVSQEQVARKAKVSSSTLARAFSGEEQVKTQVSRQKLLDWGDILLELCAPEDRNLLLAMEAEMLHALGYATRREEEEGSKRLEYYQEQVKQVLSKRDKNHG